MNFLSELNTKTGYNDETGKVNLNEIDSMVSALENNVNIFGFKPERVIEDFKDNYPNDDNGRYAVNRLFNIALQWIWFWANVPSWKEDNNNEHYHKSVDPRNEKTVELCKEINRMPEYQDMFSFYAETPDYNEQALYNAIFSDQNILTLFYINLMKKVNQTMHKTNIQTATQLMLYALSTASDKRAKKIVEKLKEERGERYYSLPLV